MQPARIARRTFLLSLVPLLAVQVPLSVAQAQQRRRSGADPSARRIVGELRHRGFTMQLAISGLPNRAALETAMRHQLDIVADSGVKPQILALWRSIPLMLVPSTGKGGGEFRAGHGIEIDAVPTPPPENPVVLHEFIHALHYRYLPQGNANPDVMRFYQIAVQNQLYPEGSYVLKNRSEFFAVTGSLYLWGKVARPPHDRETLRTKQPRYYQWLGDLFGVKK